MHGGALYASLPAHPFFHIIKQQNTMNSTLTTLSFKPPIFKLQPTSQQRLLPPRQQQIVAKWATPTKKQDCMLKPVRATLGPNTTGGLNNSTNYRGTTLPSSPLSNLIQEFYSSLNEKDIKRLEKLIAPDCVTEDTAYYKPLDTKNTHTYFRKLMGAMGKNAKFVIDEISQGLEPTVAVMWHLEWNGKFIPFTKGCSFYICSGAGAAFPIRKIYVFNETPVKPCKLALEVLNIVTNLFDTFPKIAEGFLNNPERAAQPFVRLYKTCMKPFIIPLLAYYTHFWTYLSQGLTMIPAWLQTIKGRMMSKGTSEGP